MQTKNLNAKIKQLWRNLQREILGESNRKIVRVPCFSRFPVPSYTTATSIPNPNNRLEFEDNRVLLEGDTNDIHRIRCLDAMIGKITKSFNSSAAVPKKALAKIERHIADVADSLQRVQAYRLDGEKRAVEYLWYSKTCQDIAAVKLG
jgi:hypothetical protein